MADDDLRGRVAVVTGGGSGIGRACARSLVTKGVRVAVLDRDTHTASAAVAELAELGELQLHVVDVTDDDAVAAVVASVVQQWGRLDFLVNAAGIGGGGPVPVDELDVEVLDRVHRVNVRGTFSCTKHVVAAMRALGCVDGSVVNIGSYVTGRGVAGLAAYGSSKAAVAGLTRASALDCAGTGIRVNAVCPGVIRTPLIEQLPPERQEAFTQMTPMGRMGEPSEIADVVVWLCSRQSSFVTGALIAADGGMTAR